MKIYAAIDPGAKGGLAILDHVGKLVACYRFDGLNPAKVVAEVLRPIKGSIAAVAVERVGAAPGQGVSSMFTFGVNVGLVKGALVASGISFLEVSPQTWQRIVMGVADGNPKERAKAFAVAKWGEGVLTPTGCRLPHSGAIDAACMAEYLRATLENGQSVPVPKKTAKKRVMTL